MRRRPPRATCTGTLCPYTTLVRSARDWNDERPAQGRGRAAGNQRISDRMGRSATTSMTPIDNRSAEHTSELQSPMRISYAVFCWQKKNTTDQPDDASLSITRTPSSHHSRLLNTKQQRLHKHY